MYAIINNDTGYLDLTSLNAKIIGKETFRHPPTIKKVKANNNYRNHIFKIDDNQDELEVKFLLIGNLKSTLWKNARILTNQLLKCNIKFSSEDYTYFCVIKEYSDQFITNNKLVVTVKFDCECLGDIVKYTLTESTNIFIDGAKDTFINLKVTALESVSNVVINDIKIESLNQHDVIHIISDEAKVLLNNENAINNVEIYEFPYTKGNYFININTDKVVVELSYRSRW